VIVPNALAGNLYASGDYSYISYNLNLGVKTFTYKVGYNAVHTVSAGQDIVNYHDFITYKTITIHPPDIGNGNASLNELVLVNASNNTPYDYLYATNFSNGSHNGWLLPGGAYIFKMLKSDNSLAGPSSMAYRVKVGTSFVLNSSWVPNNWLESCHTGSF